MLEAFYTFQSQLVAAVTSGQLKPELLPQIVPVGQLTAEQALEVYRKDYIARLSGVLADLYPAVQACLGAGAFAECCLAFLGLVTSRYADLGDFGREFPDFLAQQVGAKLPYLKDLALLEIRLRETFHQAASQPAHHAELLQSAADPAHLRFELQPHCSLLSSSYAIYSLWHWHLQAQSQPQPAWREPQRLLVYKQPSGVRSSLLTASQAELLRALMQGQSLEQALEQLSEPEAPELATQVQQLFALLAQQGLILRLLGPAQPSVQQ